MSTADPMLVRDDAGPKIAGTIWALVAISAVFLALRLYVKATVHRHVWWDDGFLLAAWAMLTATAAIDTYGVTQGFGKHMQDMPAPNVVTLGMLVSVSSVFSLLGAAWSKTSFALTLLRLTDSHMRTAIWLIIGTLNAALTANAVLPFARCAPVARGWNPRLEGGDACWFTPDVVISYSVFAGVYSAAMDFLLALIPWAVILHLRMNTKEKMGVALCMSLGFVAGATAIVRVTLIPLLSRADFTYQGGRLAIWTVAEIATTIMAASVPVLRPLVTKHAGGGGGGSSRHPYRPSADDGTFYLKPPRPFGGASTAAHATSTVCTSEGRPAEKRAPSRMLSKRHRKPKDEATAAAAVAAREVNGGPKDDDDDNDHDDSNNSAWAEGKIIRVQTINVAYDVRASLRSSMRSLVSPAVPPAAAAPVTTRGGGVEMEAQPPSSKPRSKLGHMLRQS